MNKPNVLLFDIDNTLLDFSAGAMQAMEEIFRAAGLPYAPEMFAVFQVENDKLWARKGTLRRMLMTMFRMCISQPGRGSTPSLSPATSRTPSGRPSTRENAVERTVT